MAAAGADFTFRFPGLTTRMFDGEQKIFLDILAHIALDGPRIGQNEDKFGNWKGFWDANRGMATSMEMLSQPKLNYLRLKKNGIDGKGWVQDVGPAHLTVRTNHCCDDSEGNSVLLMDTVLTFSDKESREKAPADLLSSAPADAYTCTFKVRWSDLGASGNAGLPYMASLAYDALTAGVRAQVIQGVTKENIRHHGVRHMKLSCYGEAAELQVLRLTLWTVEKRNDSALLDLPGRKEEADETAKKTLICLISDADKGDLLAHVEFQLHTQDTWIPWVSLVGEGTENFEYPYVEDTL